MTVAAASRGVAHKAASPQFAQGDQNEVVFEMLNARSADRRSREDVCADLLELQRLWPADAGLLQNAYRGGPQSGDGKGDQYARQAPSR